MFAKRLRELRKAKGVKQEELAEYLGVSRVMISNYENEDEEKGRMPSRERLEKIADYFNVSMDYLTGRSEEAVTYSQIEKDFLEDINLKPEVPLETLIKQAMNKYDLKLNGRSVTEKDVEHMIEEIQAHWYIRQKKKDQLD